MPWYPFFQKIMVSDVFVILSHCQFEKNGFQNRFNMDNEWYTMSVKKGLKSIIEKQYNNPQHDWKKLKKRLYDYNLDIFDDCIVNSLSETNSNIIIKICDILDIKTKIVYDYETDLKSNERLIDICLKNKCDTYLSGIGAKEYINEKLFYNNGIKIIYQYEDKMIKKPILKMI